LGREGAEAGEEAETAKDEANESESNVI